MDIDSTNPKRLRIRNHREKLSIIYYFYTIYIICIQTHNIGEETYIDITKNPFNYMFWSLVILVQSVGSTTRWAWYYYSRIHEVRYFYVRSPASSYIKLRLLMYELAGKHPSTSLILIIGRLYIF